MGDHNSYCSENFSMRSYKSISGDNSKNYEGLDTTIIYENDVLLIDLIKGYPHLYDKSLKLYKDQLIKEKSWLEISEIMQLSGKCFFFFSLIINVKKIFFIYITENFDE